MTHLDLFSGIGGFAIAAQACGYTTIGFCEREPYAQAVLRKHWPDVPICDDIFKLTSSDVRRILGACYENARTVKQDPSSESENLIASNATQFESLNGGQKTGNTTEKSKLNGAKKSGGKWSSITEVNARAVVNHNTSSLPSTTSSTTETTKENDTKDQHGRSLLGGDFQTITPSFVTTATKQEHTSEYVHTRRISLLTAGFPCQPFSVAGKRAGENDDRHLWPQITRLLQELSATGEQPDWCLFENVAGIVTMELDNILSDLEALGYSAWPLVIPACAVDARHRRDRVWIIARRSLGDSSSKGLSQRGRSERDTRNTEEGAGMVAEPERSGEDVADADEPSGKGNERTERSQQERAEHKQHCGRITQSTVCGMADGIPEGLDSGGGFCQWPEEDHETPRVTTGMKHRAHRLKGLGNAIVVQVATEIIRAISLTMATHSVTSRQ